MVTIKHTYRQNGFNFVEYIAENKEYVIMRKSSSKVISIYDESSVLSLSDVITSNGVMSITYQMFVDIDEATSTILRLVRVAVADSPSFEEEPEDFTEMITTFDLPEYDIMSIDMSNPSDVGITIFDYGLDEIIVAKYDSNTAIKQEEVEALFDVIVPQLIFNTYADVNVAKQTALVRKMFSLDW